MRLVEVHPDPDGGPGLGFHPVVTLLVAERLDPATLAETTGVLDDLAAGRTPRRPCRLADAGAGAAPGPAADPVDGLPAGDRGALAGAIAAVEVALDAGAERVPHPGARALAETWRLLLERVEASQERIRREIGDPDELAEERERAREEFHRARAAATRRPITPAEDERLCALHDTVTGSGGLGGLARRGGRRNGEAAAELERLLAEIGYPTWTAYRMGDGLTQVSPEAVADAERARRHLEEIEAVWERFAALVAADDELVDLLESLDIAQQRAHELLGARDGDLIALDDVTPDALDAVTVERAEVAVELEDARRHLAAVLADAQIPAAPAAGDPAALVAAARDWLEVLRRADAAALAASDEEAARLASAVSDAVERWRADHLGGRAGGVPPVLVDARGRPPAAWEGELGSLVGTRQVVLVVEGADEELLATVRRIVTTAAGAEAAAGVGWALELHTEPESMASPRA